jgi:polyhydroxyalkanoate synthase subunit PhaC
MDAYCGTPATHIFTLMTTTTRPHPLAADKPSETTAAPLPHVQLPTEVLSSIQKQYLEEAAAIWNQSLASPPALPLPDKRFAADAWHHSNVASFMAAMYLLNTKTVKQMANALEGDERLKKKLSFSVAQWADASSPANFFALNPEVQRLAVDTGGQSLAQGVSQLVDDILKGHLSQTDESAFQVGGNLAVTPGTVVFENAFFQLIEYKPSTEKVKELPLLFVPPCINKFYILDLSPENSLVQYMVSQGHRVFMVSWVNADETLSTATWDDYTAYGIYKAIDVVRDIANVYQINAMGFCIGATLLAAGLASLAARNEKPVASLTLLASFLDFHNTGVMDVFVDEESVELRELTIGAQSPNKGGLMKGIDLSTTFSFLRPNELVWNYVVSNYLKGQTPPPFDLLYWNSDGTNLPGPMYCWYLRNTYLENRMKDPGGTTVCGQPVDFRKLDMPAFIYASREDHIVPWDSAYASNHLISGPKTFVLGASGHIAGVINPPAKQKRSYWTVPAPKASISRAKGRITAATTWPDADTWLTQAKEHPGSWWPTWAAWLEPLSGAWVKAPIQQGNKKYPPIEPAPGRYAQKRA